MKGTGGGEPGERSWLPGAGPSPRERQTPAFGLGTAGAIPLFPPLWALLIAAALSACGRRASCLLGCSGVWGLGFPTGDCLGLVRGTKRWAGVQRDNPWGSAHATEALGCVWMPCTMLLAPETPNLVHNPC